MKKIFILLTIFLFLPIHTLFALERFSIVTTEEMQHLLAERKAGTKDFILVNTLDEMIFRNMSIPGSVNVPLGKIEKNIHKLGQNKEKLIVTY